MLAIEDEHGELRVAEVELMDEPLVGLAAEVPQPDLALAVGPIGGGR